MLSDRSQAETVARCIIPPKWYSGKDEILDVVKLSSCCQGFRGCSGDGRGLNRQSMGDEGCGTDMAGPHCLMLIRPVERTAPTVNQRTAVDNKEMEGTSGNAISTLNMSSVRNGWEEPQIIHQEGRMCKTSLRQPLLCRLHSSSNKPCWSDSSCSK